MLGESYTNDSYAFLVDSDGVIINHPNAEYQKGEKRAFSIEDTEYASPYNNKNKITLLKDYLSRLTTCLCRGTDSGFAVVVASSFRNVYGGTVAAAEEARNANLAKSRFLSQMSHEIRTLMNAILGIDSIALKDDTISERTRDELEKIGASARHLLSLINDILDMSRIESGRMELKEEVFWFDELMDQISVIIALTANAFEEDVKTCLDAGMNAHQAKPVDIELLKSELSRLLTKNDNA